MQNKNNVDETILDPIFNVIPRADTNLIRDCVILHARYTATKEVHKKRRRGEEIQIREKAQMKK